MTQDAKECVYARYNGDITHDMLNKAYSEAGMFFKTLSEAQMHQAKAGGKIYLIKNYHFSAFSGRRLLPDAKPYVQGYYVSHPQELRPHPEIYQFKTKRRTL